MADAIDIRAELTVRRHDIERMQQDREGLVVQGAELGMQKTELATLSGLSRQTVYDLLARHAEEQQAAEKSAVDRVASLWTPGQVVEDRWGLRWRADSPAEGPRRGEQQWKCRSVGLHTWLPHDRMAQREPLKLIRVDRAGKESRAAWRAGEAEDAAVTVAPHEDPEP